MCNSSPVTQRDTIKSVISRIFIMSWQIKYDWWAIMSYLLKNTVFLPSTVLVQHYNSYLYFSNPPHPPSTFFLFHLTNIINQDKLLLAFALFFHLHPSNSGTWIFVRSKSWWWCHDTFLYEMGYKVFWDVISCCKRQTLSPRKHRNFIDILVCIFVFCQICFEA